MNSNRILTLTIIVLFSLTGFAKTPDGVKPAGESICDLESGAAYGLCNAYCEAMDCDSEYTNASEVACLKVEENWIKITGREYLPCEPDLCPAPIITSVYPNAIMAPAYGGVFFTGAFHFEGFHFQGAEVYTDGPLVVINPTRVNAEGTYAERDYSIGCCEPHNWIGQTFSLAVVNACGEDKVDILIEGIH